MKHLNALDQELARVGISQRKQTSIQAYFQPVRAVEDE